MDIRDRDPANALNAHFAHFGSPDCVLDRFRVYEDAESD